MRRIVSGKPVVQYGCRTHPDMHRNKIATEVKRRHSAGEVRRFTACNATHEIDDPSTAEDIQGSGSLILSRFPFQTGGHRRGAGLMESKPDRTKVALDFFTLLERPLELFLSE